MTKTCSNAQKVRAKIRKLKKAPICVHIGRRVGPDHRGEDEPNAGKAFYGIFIKRPPYTRYSSTGELSTAVESGYWEGSLWWKSWVAYDEGTTKRLIRVAKGKVGALRKARIADMEMALRSLP